MDGVGGKNTEQIPALGNAGLGLDSPVVLSFLGALGWAVSCWEPAGGNSLPVIPPGI